MSRIFNVNIEKRLPNNNPSPIITTESNKDDKCFEELISSEDFKLLLESAQLFDQESEDKPIPLSRTPTQRRKVEDLSLLSTGSKTYIKTETKATKKKQIDISFQLTSQNSFEIKLNVILSNEINRFFRKQYGTYYHFSNSWSFKMNYYEVIFHFIATSPLCKEYTVSFLTELALRCHNEPDSPNVIEYKSKENLVIKMDYSKDLRPSVTSLPQELLSSLYPFQLKGIEYGISKHCRFLLADEMGIGKTLQAICLSLLYKADWPVLVVCPSPLIFIWRDELSKWSKSIHYQILSTSKDTFCKGADFFIVSYDLILKIAEKLTKMSFKFIIADEGHLLRNSTTQRAKVLIPYMSKAKRVIAMTGTPIVNYPGDIFSLLKALRPDLFKSQKAFIDRYCYKNSLLANANNYMGVAANKKEFNYILSKIMIRRLKEDVLMDLPPKRRQKIEIVSSNEHLSQIKILIRKAKEQKQIDFSKLNALNDNENIDDFLETSDPSCKLDLSSSFLCFNKAYSLSGLAKVNGIINYIGCLIESKCPLVIYAHHIEVLDCIEEFIQSTKVGYIRLDGNVPINQREDKIKAFQTKSNCLIALLSITGFALGISLSKASTVVFAELHFTSSLMLQAEDRVHRIGQNKSVNVHYLYAKDTVDDMLLAQMKENFFFITDFLDKKKPKLLPNSSTNPIQRSDKSPTNLTTVKANKCMDDYFTPVKINQTDSKTESKAKSDATTIFTEEGKRYEKALKLNNFI